MIAQRRSQSFTSTKQAAPAVFRGTKNKHNTSEIVFYPDRLGTGWSKSFEFSIAYISILL